MNDPLELPAGVELQPGLSQTEAVMERLARHARHGLLNAPYCGFYRGIAALTVATDGFVAILASGISCGGRTNWPFNIDFLLDSLPTWWITVRVADLRAWCGHPVWPGGGTCPACKGAKEIECTRCRGRGECPRCDRECDECHDGKATCERCRGSGEVSDLRPEARPGAFFNGVRVDRVLLARALEAFSGEAVIEVAGRCKYSPIELWAGGDVAAFVCSYRADDEDLDVPVWEGA